MRPYLEQLRLRQHLTRHQTKEAFTYITSGQAHEAEIASFLSLLSAKGETPDEVTGIVSALQAGMIRVSVPFDTLDIVGTGGDGHDTVNISTAASIVAAAAGCKVAKHGNRGGSSKSGSADVLQSMGVNLELEAAGVEECLQKVGIGFMFAQKFHPGLKYVAPVRKAMGIRTVVNNVGPLLNPADSQYMVLGVFTPVLLDMMADVLVAKGVKRAVVVHAGGLDEFSNTAEAHVVEVNDGVKTRRTFDPLHEIRMPRAQIGDLKGGDPAHNAAIIRRVLAGQLQGPITDAIALNAGAGCYVYGLDGTIGDGVERARDVIRSGKAVEKLDEWVEITQQFGMARADGALLG
eukprot:GFKZ01011548.1.p2 GENE.GFKZ01011548.1~~GFKZ01011548.1.p2  ORF type:complete len:380 (+),score=55.68 GFKZ01011548.1:97-1140(+)